MTGCFCAQSVLAYRQSCFDGHPTRGQVGEGKKRPTSDQLDLFVKQCSGFETICYECNKMQLRNVRKVTCTAGRGSNKPIREIQADIL